MKIKLSCGTYVYVTKTLHDRELYASAIWLTLQANGHVFYDIDTRKMWESLNLKGHGNEIKHCVGQLKKMTLEQIKSFGYARQCFNDRHYHIIKKSAPFLAKLAIISTND